MKRVLAPLLVAALVSCREPVASEPTQGEPSTPPTPFAYDCDAGDRAFVRRALLAVLGRHPAGQAEVDAYEQAVAEAGRAGVARALMREPSYRERWSDFVMDALRVARTGAKSLEQCYGSPSSLGFDGGALAAYVREHEATNADPPTPGFTMHELLRSALELDDLSVVYRAHLFAMMSRQLTGNASELEVELARRNDYGMAFEAAYTNRAQDCLPCHNSEYSVTHDFWPVTGRFERELFGLPSGVPASGNASGLLRSRSASLVALNFVEKVWIETAGKPLTIAHHFPRTTEQRDVLTRLTDRFVRARFSLQTLLADIVTEPIFNLLPPSAGCGAQPYALPRVFDPWTDAEQDPAKRGNSVADAVFPISPRPLRKALHFALEWPPYPEYPAEGSAEAAFQLALGFALRDGDPGQRALDFQGRLAWEAAYGACEPPEGVHDFVSKLAERALNEQASVLWAVTSLKDRLLGTRSISETERRALEALVGALQVPAGADLEGKLRVICGVMVASPWFQLGGVVVEG